MKIIQFAYIYQTLNNNKNIKIFRTVHEHQAKYQCPHCRGTIHL